MSVSNVVRWSWPLHLLSVEQQKLLVVLEEVVVLRREGPELLNAHQQQVIVRVVRISLPEQSLHTDTQKTQKTRASPPERDLFLIYFLPLNHRSMTHHSPLAWSSEAFFSNNSGTFGHFFLFFSQGSSWFEFSKARVTPRLKPKKQNTLKRRLWGWRGGPKRRGQIPDHWECVITSK